jgi:TldD protein
MIRFPKGRYSDIRIEEVFQTDLVIENGVIRQNRVRTSKGALIRIYDGDKWYYQATTHLDNLQHDLDALAELTKKRSADELEHDPVIQIFEVNRDQVIRYADCSVKQSDRNEKLALLQHYGSLCASVPEINIWKAYYKDVYTVQSFLSSKGSDIKHDFQSASATIRYDLDVDGKKGRGGKDLVKTMFAQLPGHDDVIKSEIDKDIDFTRRAKPVKPGLYTCVLAPVVTGVFAHESFGHKSEADFMIGDETMMKAWAIGSTVGSSALNIIDRGDMEGNGYVPYDDDGTRARCSYVVKNGRLAGRLHSAVTAASLQEGLTGNARAVNFEFEPIVRMTNTYIDGGKMTREALLEPIQEGLYIEDLHHGSGMTTFTIAPHRAYMIRNGKIAEPVQISVISGNVMKTLHNIDGFSKDVEYFSFAMGGCGKMEQFPLRVSFGGPTIRVNGLYAQ